MIKLAITISGAVSLGTFEAGALYEVLKALEHHNSPFESDSPGRIEIDVLTGASAGGMSACIVAQKLLYDATQLSKPLDNALYNAWVVEADLSSLLTTSSGDQQSLSILSSSCIRQIADKFIAGKYDPASSKPHLAAAKRLKVGLALSNLNGIDYSVDIYGGGANQSISGSGNSNGKTVTNATLGSAKGNSWLSQFATGKFVYTRYQDELVDTFDGQDFNVIAWDRLRLAAVSCGAFPFAFEPVELLRDKSEYLTKGPSGFPDTDGKYVHTDGGVFQNEPLGLAKNLVDQLALSQSDDGADRYYLYIAPGAKDSSMELNPIKLSDMTIVHMGSALTKALFNQARFQDWVTAEQVNQDVALLDARAAAIARILQEDARSKTGRQLSGTLIQSVTKPLMDVVFGLRIEHAEGGERSLESQEQARSRLERQYSTEFNSFGRDLDLANAWLDLVALLEQAAQLASKDQMKIFGITAHESELAGGKLCAFQGFFDRALRDHDYSVGRKKAREILRSLSSVLDHGFPAEDSDITWDKSKDGFDIFLSQDEKYLDLMRKLVARSFDYASNQVVSDGVIRRRLANLLGVAVSWMVMRPLVFYFWMAVIGLLLVLGGVELWRHFT